MKAPAVLRLLSIFFALVLLAGPASAQRVTASKGGKKSVAARTAAKAASKTRGKTTNRKKTAKTSKSSRRTKAAVFRRATRQDARPARSRAKNRGKLATLDGIRPGKKYKLVDPSTGKTDPGAKVIETATDRDTKIPFAQVEFSSGHIERYAAERLQLVGRDMAFQRRYYKESRQKVFRAIEKELGVKVEGVTLVSLNGRTIAPPDLGKETYLGPFLRALNEPLHPGLEVGGFQKNGRAVVNRHYAAFDIATPTHEVLHGLTRPFVEQMLDKDLLNVMEGMTDYFTYRVVTPHFGLHQKPNDAYGMYTKFAEQVAKKIGPRELQRIFFGKGDRLVEKLADKVDAKVGRKGAFMDAARDLENGRQASLD